jgi:hypothetical protein
MSLTLKNIRDGITVTGDTILFAFGAAYLAFVAWLAYQIGSVADQDQRMELLKLLLSGKLLASIIALLAGRTFAPELKQRIWPGK